jgi:hypothetical protein
VNQGCLGENAAHDFIAMRGEIDAANQKRLGRNDIAGWSWCKRCGASLEVYCGVGTRPQITLPTYSPEKQCDG